MGFFSKSLKVKKFAPDGIELVRTFLLFPCERFFLQNGYLEYKNVTNPSLNIKRRLAEGDEVFVGSSPVMSQDRASLILLAFEDYGGIRARGVLI